MDPGGPFPAPPSPPPADRGRPAGVVVAVLVVAALVVAGVVALILANVPADEATDTPSSSASPANLSPGAPRAVHAHASPFQVTVTWREAKDGGEVMGYQVFRNGKMLDDLAGAQGRFIDNDALPSSMYRYGVQAYGAASTEPSRRVYVVVHTGPAPTALARLKGTFNVRMHLTSSYGIEGLKGTTGGWKFTPECDDGPCDVRFADIHHAIPSTDLKHAAATYEGEDSGNLGITCSGVDQTSSFHVRVRVVAAAAVAGEWRATRIEGTYSFSQPAALGCRSGGATYDITGRVVGS